MLNLFRRDLKKRQAKRSDDRLKREQNRRSLDITIRHLVDEGDLPLDGAYQKVTLSQLNPLGRAADSEDVALSRAERANGEAEVFDKHPHHRQAE